MSGRVFIVQRPAYKDRATGEWVLKYDLTPAEEHGELVDIMPVGPSFWDINSIVAQAERVLADYNPDVDHILAMGDPVAIAAASLVAGKSGGVSVLKWDKKAQRYQPFFVQV